MKLLGGIADGRQDGVADSAGSQAAQSGPRVQAVPSRPQRRERLPYDFLSAMPGSPVRPAGVTHLARSSRKITLLQQPAKTRPTAKIGRMAGAEE